MDRYQRLAQAIFDMNHAGGCVEEVAQLLKETIEGTITESRSEARAYFYRGTRIGEKEFFRLRAEELFADMGIPPARPRDCELRRNRMEEMNAGVPDTFASRPMPKYIGTKIIEAMPSRGPNGEPGYSVRYEDGYTSWSPAAAFEKAYRLLGTGLTFGRAIEALKAGKKVARSGWNGKGMWIVMQVPDDHSKMNLPYLYIEYPSGHPAYPNGSRVPWLASQTDMLQEDWIIVEDGPSTMIDNSLA